MPEPYHFKTEWHFRAPLERVWTVVLDIQNYPPWWKNCRHVRLVRGDGKCAGSIIECEVRGSLPYSLNYKLEVLEARYLKYILLRSTGDLVGTGRWDFGEPAPGESQAVYYWDVASTNPILNLVAPLARGALARNHERVMANGYEALHRYAESPATA